MTHETITTTEPLPLTPSEIMFCSGLPNNTWIIKLNEEGIFFNHEEWPQSEPSDFSKAFIELMEKQFAIKFIHKVDR